MFEAHIFMLDTEVLILRCIGTTGKRTKYELEKVTGLAHSTVYSGVRSLLAKGLIEEAGHEQFAKIKDVTKTYYKLSFRGALIAFKELKEEEEIHRFLGNNAEKPFFGITNFLAESGLEEIARFFVEVIQGSVSVGFINPDLINGLDAEFLMGLFFLKKCHEKLDCFIENEKQETPLKKCYQILHICGTVYSRNIITQTGEIQKKLGEIQEILEK
jgi:DNA-binding transcriptional ArsR family regulator